MTYKLKIQNFGNFTDGLLNIQETTLLIGGSPSDQNCLTKLILLFLLAEKNILLNKKIESKDFFIQDFFTQIHNDTIFKDSELDNCFIKKTKISFCGLNYLFEVEGKRIWIKRHTSHIYGQHGIIAIKQPELNFPLFDQKNIIFALLAKQNLTVDNILLVATNSPFILGYFNLAIKAYEIGLHAPENIIKKIKKIVPREAWLSGKNVAVNELHNNGKIKNLQKYDNIFISDKNILNKTLNNLNDWYEQLLTIQYSENALS